MYGACTRLAQWVLHSTCCESRELTLQFEIRICFKSMTAVQTFRPSDLPLSINVKTNKQCSRQLQCEVPCGVGNVINMARLASRYLDYICVKIAGVWSLPLALAGIAFVGVGNNLDVYYLATFSINLCARSWGSTHAQSCNSM